MQPDQDQTEGDMFCDSCADLTLPTECCDQCGCCGDCCECPNCGCDRCSKVRAAAVAELRTIAAARRADETIDETMSWAAGTLKAIVDQVATGNTGVELTVVADHLAGQVTSHRRAQVLLLMFGHALDDLRYAAKLDATDGHSFPVVDLARDYFEYHQGAALADIALDGS
jgi:hypothetical protein